MTISFQEAPLAQSTRLLDYTDIYIGNGITEDTFFVSVSGEKPFVNMEVKLIPLIYVTRPDYWEIEVVGILSPINIPQEAKYSVSLPLDNIRGKKGIIIIGGTGSKQIDIPPK